MLIVHYRKRDAALPGAVKTIGALATLTFEVSDWHELRAGAGELSEFVKPRELG